MQNAKHLDGADKHTNIPRKRPISLLVDYFLEHGSLIFSQKTEQVCARFQLNLFIHLVQYPEGVVKFFDQT